MKCLRINVILTLFVCGIGNFVYAEDADSIRVYTLDEVVSTGTRSATDARLLPLSVSVVSEAQLEEKQETNILPTLSAEVPGLFVTSRGMMGYGVSTGGSGTIKIRGIGGGPNTDMLVLIDGVPQYAGLYGHPVADNYQTMIAERVEVVRGPASLLYGSNAMGGVVNILTPQLKRDSIVTDIHLQGGSYYTLDAGIGNRVRRGRFSSHAGFNYSRSSGHRANMGFDEYNGMVRLGYELSDHWRIGGMGNIAYFHSQNPGTEAAPIEDNHMYILRGMGTIGIENRYAKTSGAIRIYYSGGHHRINEGYSPGGTPQTRMYHHRDVMAGGSVYQTVCFFRGNRTTFGFDYHHFGGHAWYAPVGEGSEQEIIRKTQYELAGYVDFHQHVVSWFALDAGIRFDWHSVAGIAYIPQGGLSFMLPHDAEVKALVSRGFRNPTIRELYMYAPANEELKAQSLWNYEISYRQHLLDRRLRLGANLFFIQAQNMIETRMIDGKPKNVNTGATDNIGCEIEGAYRIIQGLEVSANYSYLHMSKVQVAAPEHKLNIALRYHHERFRIGTDMQYIHGLYVATGAQEKKENYLLWNAHAAYRIWRGLWVHVKADNLLAQEYEINLGFPMPRTTVMGGVRWKI